MAKCGSQGPMICLNSAVCNATTGNCDHCPPGFRNDDTVFQGNQNCGLVESAIYAIYFIAGFFAIVVCLINLHEGYLYLVLKRNSRMKKLLFLASFWNFLLPIFLFCHYIEGFRFGIASTTFCVFILMCIQTQLMVFEYSLEMFLNFMYYHENPQTAFKIFIYSYIFWIINKFTYYLVILAGLVSKDTFLSNSGMLYMTVSVLFENIVNVSLAMQRNLKFVKGVKNLHIDNEVISSLAKKLETIRYMGPLFVIVIASVTITIITLYVVYDSSIPYSFILFALLVFITPMMGIMLLVLLKGAMKHQLIRSSSLFIAKNISIPVIPRKSHLTGADAHVVVRASSD